MESNNKYEVVFYEDIRGESQILTYMAELEAARATNKRARIELKQIHHYIDYLQAFGAHGNTEISKQVKGNIWELRPGDNRILYYYSDGKTFVLLHYFRKKTNKTPQREIERAENEMNDYIKRSAKI